MDVTLRHGEQQRGLGERFEGRRGELHVQVRAAPWVTVDRMTVWVNGRIYRQLPCRGNDHKTIELHVENDAWVVVELKGPAGERYQQMLPGLSPLALSNPIYIDADSNGRWQPLGN